MEHGSRRRRCDTAGNIFMPKSLFEEIMRAGAHTQ